MLFPEVLYHADAIAWAAIEVNVQENPTLVVELHAVLQIENEHCVRGFDLEKPFIEPPD
jgi:hypothetical protein